MQYFWEDRFQTCHRLQDFLLSGQQVFNFFCCHCHSKSLTYCSVLYLSYWYQILSFEIYSWGKVFKHFYCVSFQIFFEHKMQSAFRLRISSWKYQGQGGHKNKLLEGQALFSLRSRPAGHYGEFSNRRAVWPLAYWMLLSFCKVNNTTKKNSQGGKRIDA